MKGSLGKRASARATAVKAREVESKAVGIPQVDDTVGGTVVISAITSALDFTGALSATKTIDCTNVRNGATVVVYSVNGITSVLLSGTGLTIAGDLSTLAAGQSALITRNGNNIYGRRLSFNHLVQSRSTSAPNATVPAHRIVPVGTEADIDIVISPKQSGAVLTNLPDSTTTGGDKRGQCAVDLQTNRINANQVASGFAATVAGGSNNKAVGSHAVVGGGTGNSANGTRNTIAGGYNNTASNDDSVIGGGSTNTASGGNSTVAGGGVNAATGNYATAGGGYGNTAGLNATVGGGYTNSATADGDTVAGGYGNAASGYRSTIVGGFNNVANGGWTIAGGHTNTASGSYATALGGNLNIANATLAIAEGQDGNTKGRESSYARGNGKFAVSGDAQRVEQELRGTTTDATATTIGTRGQVVGNTTAFFMSDNSAATFQFIVVARAGTDTAHYIITGGATKGGAGTAAIVGAVGVTTVESAGATAWNATAVAFGNGVALQVTGEAAKTIKWVATMTAVEVVG